MAARNASLPIDDFIHYDGFIYDVGFLQKQGEPHIVQQLGQSTQVNHARYDEI